MRLIITPNDSFYFWERKKFSVVSQCCKVLFTLVLKFCKENFLQFLQVTNFGFELKRVDINIKYIEW